MKRLLLICALALAGIGGSTINAQDDGSGTRVDYYDKFGDWVSSDYVFTGYYLFRMNHGEDGNWNVLNPNGMSDRIATMKFVPYGTQSYPLSTELSEGFEDIEVTYEIITEDETRRVVAKAGEGPVDVKCGSLIRFHISVPADAYPNISYHDEYSGYFSDGTPYYGGFYSFPFEQFKLYGFYNSTNSSGYRSNVIDSLNGETSAFKRVEGEPGHWTIDLGMPNEPMTVYFYYTRPTAQMMLNLADQAMRSLYSQFNISTFNAPFITGDPYIMQSVGEYFGNDYVSDLARMAYLKFEYINSLNSVIPFIPWVLCDRQIATANLLLTYLNLFDGYVTDAEKANVRAQMLTLRSHAYWRLLQIYGNRWQDSDNGEAYCAPLCLSYVVEDQPLAKMKDIFAQCYADLDEAISILSATEVERYDILTPTADVARGVKMRLAMLKEDWLTAQSLAQTIVNNYQVSTAEDMTAGFFAPTRSWIWGAPNEINSTGSHLYYWAAEGQNACNGWYPQMWGYAPGAIDRQLYDKIPNGDIRKTMFVTPDNISGTTWESLYSSLNSDYAITDPQIYDKLAAKTPDGVQDNAYTYEGEQINVPICGQFKFFASTPYPFDANDAVVFMRMEEALLTLAEAAWHNGNEVIAKEALIKLNENRNPGYSCTATGQALLDEIRLQRKIELWGEGFSWFDDKRWNLPVERNTGRWDSPGSLDWSWPEDMSMTVAPDEYNGWRYVIPENALFYNPLIDVTLMNYQGVEYRDLQTAPAKTAPFGNRPVQPIKEPQKAPVTTLTVK